MSSFLLLMASVPAYAVDTAPQAKQSGSWMGGLAALIFFAGVAVASFMAPKRTHKD